MRTQDEIVARMDGLKDDLLGFKSEVLLDWLDFEHAKPWLVDGATEAQWAEAHKDTGSLEDEAKSYLAFAYGKAVGHRGISAGRSIDKMTEFMWLMGRDDVVAAIEAAPYPNYGMPKLVVISDMLGWPKDDHEYVARMAAGLPCREDCDEGCGR